MNRTAVLSAEKAHAWEALADLFVINNDRDYEQMIDRINALADQIGDNPSHPLAGLLDTMATVALNYEATHYEVPKASPVEVIKFLMEEHSLGQKDLPEIGTQGVVSEILRGLRQLNTRQVAALAGRFGVSPAVFISPSDKEK